MKTKNKGIFGYSIIKTDELVAMVKAIEEMKYDIEHTVQFRELKKKYSNK